MPAKRRPTLHSLPELGASAEGSSDPGKTPAAAPGRSGFIKGLAREGKGNAEELDRKKSGCRDRF